MQRLVWPDSRALTEIQRWVRIEAWRLVDPARARPSSPEAEQCGIHWQTCSTRPPLHFATLVSWADSAVTRACVAQNAVSESILSGFRRYWHHWRATTSRAGIGELLSHTAPRDSRPGNRGNPVMPILPKSRARENSLKDLVVLMLLTSMFRPAPDQRLSQDSWTHHISGLQPMCPIGRTSPLGID